MTDKVKKVRARDKKWAYDTFYGGFRIHNVPGRGLFSGGCKVLLCPDKRLINFKTEQEAKDFIDKFRQGFLPDNDEQGQPYRRIEL